MDAQLTAHLAQCGTMDSTQISGRQDLLRVLLVSTCDIGGGAEHTAWNVYKALGARGHNAVLAVGDKRSDEHNVLVIPNDSSRNAWARLWLRLSGCVNSTIGHIPGAKTLQAGFRFIGEPRRRLDIMEGREDFYYPGTQEIFRSIKLPDIIHCYNLHGHYFDLRVLPWLSNRTPLILDLRDAWLLSGHCAHSFDCDRWKTGCGSCPDLRIPPSIARDATAFNWERKRKIYADSKIFVVTPCNWLMSRIQESILRPAVVASRVIPTGVDLEIFRPEEKSVARSALRLSQNQKILLFAANGVRRHRWKDYKTLRDAFARVAENFRGEELLFIALGEDAPTERIGNATIRFVPHQKSVETVAHYYQSADLYVHAARADTFPRVILEALACGTPVVATAIGGIPEEVRSLKTPYSVQSDTYPLDEATGILTSVGDATAMGSAIEALLSDDDLRRRLSENAERDARSRFSLQNQVQKYVDWYWDVMAIHSGKAPGLSQRQL